MKRLTLIIASLFITSLLFGAGQGEDGDFTYGGIDTVEVDAGTFDVIVEATRGREVSMQIENYPDRFTVYHIVDGSTVRVRVEQTFSLFTPAHRGTLVFRVPASTDVDVETTTGNASLTGVSRAAVRVSTTTGSIDLEEIGGSLFAQSTTGGIVILRSSGELEVGSTTGSLEIDGFEGTVTASSTTGRQYHKDIVGQIDARSTTGRVELRDVAARLRVRTSTGSQTGHGVLLSDDSSFEATTGSIDMDLENELDELEFDLTSTTGSLRVGDERSQRRLFFGGSGIAVNARTSTGSQRFY
ncbi:MAG: DUF4097 family beta strand repeat-containing protein [Spirochaetota bacterium]